MSATDWIAEVQRMDPKSDALIVKVKRRITRHDAEQIKGAIHAQMPNIKVLIFDESYSVVIVSKSLAKTLVRGRRKRP